MKKLTTLTIALLFSGAVSAEVAVIVHPSNNSAVDEAVISKLYLGKDKSFADGSAAVPMALPEANATTESFNEKVLKKSNSQLKAYWSKLIFTGKGTPPKEVGSDDELVALIASNPNFIGYVDASKVTDKVKVVAKF